LPSPLIGLTTTRTLSAHSYSYISVVEAYVSALIRAGASPLLIPMGIKEDGIKDVLSCLDGILFTGGGDVHPVRYGSPPHPKVKEVIEDRDQIEFQLVREAVERDLPCFGICRGLQVINVALGGTLYEDLQTQYPNSLKHDYEITQPRDFLAHEISVQEGSKLNQFLDLTTYEVNSFHHQGIRDLAPGLSITVQSPDGVIEGIELNAYPFGIAVQWHPEWMQDHPSMRALFSAFVDFARGGEKNSA
jgi:putative glutamine amidotransferase